MYGCCYWWGELLGHQPLWESQLVKKSITIIQLSLTHLMCFWVLDCLRHVTLVQENMVPYQPLYFNLDILSNTMAYLHNSWGRAFNPLWLLLISAFQLQYSLFISFHTWYGIQNERSMTKGELDIDIKW